MKCKIGIKLIIFTLYLNPNYSYASTSYKYSSLNKLDPFEPYSTAVKKDEILSILQQYELSTMELVGTMLGAEISALLYIPEARESITVRVGDKIGKKYGKIIGISHDRVVVREPTSGSVAIGSRQKYEDKIIKFIRKSTQQVASPLTPNSPDAKNKEYMDWVMEMEKKERDTIQRNENKTELQNLLNNTNLPIPQNAKP